MFSPGKTPSHITYITVIRSSFSSPQLTFWGRQSDIVLVRREGTREKDRERKRLSERDWSVFHRMKARMCDNLACLSSMTSIAIARAFEHSDILECNPHSKSKSHFGVQSIYHSINVLDCGLLHSKQHSTPTVGLECRMDSCCTPIHSTLHFLLQIWFLFGVTGGL